MPSVTDKEWMALMTPGKPEASSSKTLSKTQLITKVDGHSCFAILKRGRIAYLEIGGHVWPVEALDDYRSAALVFSHFPVGTVAAIDECKRLVEEQFK